MVVKLIIFSLYSAGRQGAVIVTSTHRLRHFTVVMIP